VGHVGRGAREFAEEFRVAAATSGLTQRQIALRARIDQSLVSRIQRGRVVPNLEMAERLSNAVGHRLSVRVLPAQGPRLRDTGQMQVAEAIRAQAHPRWKVALEMPVAPPPDLRAADLVLTQADHAIHIEIERWLRDFQAQLRRAQLQRLGLGERLERPVRLVLAVADSRSSRSVLAQHAALVQAALPMRPRLVCAAIRSVEALAHDGLLFVRPPQKGC
jgi:transcriptional regulator with XRE-family HTH domain